MTAEGVIPRLALTLGEPAGIGVELCLQIAQLPLPAEIVVVGSTDLLQQRAKLIDLPIELYEFDPSTPPRVNGKGRLAFYPIPLATTCIPGQLDVANSHYVIQTLQQAYQLCAQAQCQAMVTGPVHKAIIAQSGIPFLGHTEFLMNLARVSAVLMTFYTPKLIMGLVTTHCALHQVSSQLTTNRLQQAIEILNQGLIQLFNIPHPRIGVCGLNPHAGESGLLGTEEQTIMFPVIHTLQQKGLSLLGPLSADTAFTPKIMNEVDALLAMYHDQGLAPMKALFFGDLVNITLGLPFLRTSVDHGTALTLTGTQKADPTSLHKAILTAAMLSLRH